MHLSHSMALAALASTSLAFAIDRRAAPGADECVTTVVTTTTVTVTVTTTGDAQRTAAAPEPTTEPKAQPAVDNSYAETPSDSSSDETPAAPAADKKEVDSAGPKRGFVYEGSPNLVNDLLAKSKAQCSWAYNWGSTSGGLDESLEFVPMLWGNKMDMFDTWADIAEKALAAGSKHFLSFNEPDLPEQANMSPEDAAAAHAEHMNFGGKAQVGSPATSNSAEANQGTDWLGKFMSACTGCQVDFCVAHWYGPPDVEHLRKHLDDVHGIPGCEGKPVWLTEFAPDRGSDSDKAAFIEEALAMMDGLEWLERYSYFMVGGDGKVASLTAGVDLTLQGQAYLEVTN